ncbi:uncharacterized protein LOC126285060 [Schistocerca gregaria]|uniref:uncharacterized protein LOC126285060 n=1 Tax=Schistocerca gregaria TaxID=7010 RepID=UPI00211DC45E|nr:uncharacterized protein LOC126285060 [Schistocerca gregaria]
MPGPAASPDHMQARSCTGGEAPAVAQRATGGPRHDEVAAAGPHLSGACTKKREEPAICANCRGNHPASFRGCPERLKIVQLWKRQRVSAPKRQEPPPRGPLRNPNPPPAPPMEEVNPPPSPTPARAETTSKRMQTYRDPQDRRRMNQMAHEIQTRLKLMRCYRWEQSPQAAESNPESSDG